MLERYQLHSRVKLIGSLKPMEVRDVSSFFLIFQRPDAIGINKHLFFAV